MKKFFVLAAAAAFALVACNKDNPTVEGSGNAGEETPKPINSLVLNEVSGGAKFIELYNNTDAEISLEGYTIVKYDASKEGGKRATWTGAAGMKIASKAFVYFESSDLADEAEGGDPNYEYQSENHIFKGGLSGKKNLFLELVDAEGKVVDSFKRGDEGAGWNQVEGFNNDKKHSFSRCPDGTTVWGYADPTPGAANGAKVADIEQTPEM